MKRAFLALTVLAMAACSGNFATGTGMPQQGGVPPINAASNPPYGANGIPQGGSPTPYASVSPGVANSGTYDLSMATQGFTCPNTIDEYGCVLKFNLPAPTPSPKPGTHAAKSTPSPSPTPSETPSPTPESSGSPGPTPKPTPTPPTISLTAEALPKDAPAMYHVAPDSLQVVPLMMVHLTPTGDFKLDGWAEADFTLPKTQVEERGFAVQLFQSTTKHKKTSYTPIWTFDKSTLTGSTLTFTFDPPKMTIGKGSTYVLVLYGDDKSKASPAGSASPAATASPTATASPSPEPSAE